MKKLVLGLIAIVWAGQVANAQCAFTEDLDQVGVAAMQSRTAAKTIGLSLKTLAIDYFVQQNSISDPDSYLALVNHQTEELAEATDLIYTRTKAAVEKNGNLSPDELLASAGLIKDRTELIKEQSLTLTNQLDRGELDAALTSASQVRGYLFQIIGTSNSIMTKAEALKDTPFPLPVYDVRIVLADDEGNSLSQNTGLTGFYAYDTKNDQYYYSGDCEDQDLFLITNLPEGSYTFGAFDGYFDGAGTALLELKSDLPVNDKGEVEVHLTYWSD
jgi:hypothetical protein